LTQNYEILAQAGVFINLRKAYEMWFEAMMISDIDGMFQSPQDAQQVAQPPPEEGPQPQGPPGLPPEMAAMLAGGAPPGGEQPMEGLPNPDTSQMPSEPVTDENSGLLAPV